MKYAICPISIAPVRCYPSEKSEMGSQLLFGEMVEILERKGRLWSKIRCATDHYIGWVNTYQLQIITPREWDTYTQNFAYNMEIVQPIIGEDFYLPITMGARLPCFDGMRFSLGGSYYSFSGQAVFPENIEANVGFLIKIARRYLYAPYLWGGRSPLGIDSMGFVQMAFQLLGFSFVKSWEFLIQQGKNVDFATQARAGDLAFFENKKGRLSHAGIILPDEQIIHAFGRVRIDRFDHFGIFNENLQRYTHKLRLIKRIILKSLTKEITPNNNTKAIVSTNQIELF